MSAHVDMFMYACVRVSVHVYKRNLCVQPEPMLEVTLIIHLTLIPNLRAYVARKKMRDAEVESTRKAAETERLLE